MNNKKMSLGEYSDMISKNINRLYIVKKQIKKKGEMYVTDPFNKGVFLSLLLWKSLVIVKISELVAKIEKVHGKVVTSFPEITEHDIREAKKYVEKKKNIIV